MQRTSHLDVFFASNKMKAFSKFKFHLAELCQPLSSIKDFITLLPELNYMKRREILKYTTLATGAAIGAPLLGSILSGCTVDDVENSVDHQLKFFSNKEFEKVKDLIDTILPKTESPSASEVGVHKMIDAMVGMVYQKEDQEAYKKGFSSLMNYLEEAGNNGLLKMDADQKLSLLQKLEKESENENVRNAYLHLKQQTIAYYLSTEEVAKNYLNYLPFPGDYESCIPLADVGGKAWAL